MPIRAEYDSEADALYVRLADGQVARTVEYDHASFADLDSEGTVLGVEVLSPRRNPRLPALAVQFGFLDRLREVQGAVLEQLPAPATAVAMSNLRELNFSSVGYISGATAAEATVAVGTVTTAKQSLRQDLELV